MGAQEAHGNVAAVVDRQFARAYAVMSERYIETAQV
jgi:hypothetical protein